MSQFSIEEVLHFAQEAYPEAAVVDIEQLAQAGSDRIYYRIRNGAQRSIIGTQSANLEENERFIALANYFENAGIAVPEILAVHPSKQMYLQSEGGKQCLLDIVLEKGHTEEVKEIYKEVLLALFDVQVCAQAAPFQKLFAQCATFGYEQVLYDLNYFRINFLAQANVQFDENKLLEEFDAFAKVIGTKEQGFFMYRDFQGRNIMLGEDHDFTFIDFQGGLKGHPVYDVVSLLWQAKARIPGKWKKELLQHYLDYAWTHFDTSKDDEINNWPADYQMLTLTRLLQVLGAYGLRGLKEGKEHFISSIPLGLENIAEWLHENNLTNYPELMKILGIISKNNFIEKFK